MSTKRSEEGVRAASRALFGSSARLRAAAFIADHEEVYARQLAGAIRTAENEAGRELKHFSDAGLLDPPAKRPGGRRRQVYHRRRSSFWALAKQLLSEIENSAQ